MERGDLVDIQRETCREEMKVAWTRVVATEMKVGRLQDNVEVESTRACNQLLRRGKSGRRNV